jgi:hypothetical protein
MYGRDRDLMVVGNTDVCGEASRVSKIAREHEPHDLHPSLGLVQAILQRKLSERCAVLAVLLTRSYHRVLYCGSCAEVGK